MEVEAPRSVASTATDISLDVFGSADDGDGGAGKKQLLLPAEPQTLQWRQLSVSLKVSRKSPQRHLLNKVSGDAFPGELFVILGATASGKTTLLNILARRFVNAKGLRISGGSVTVNGRPRPRHTKCAYVTQDDVLYATLTVAETLRFHARLRLPADMPREETTARIDAVVAALGLRPCLGTRVGDDMTRGISGGERKRLAIACELVTDPALLFLDEPTSGLDAYNATNVVSCVKVLCAAGRTVVSTLHQPRSLITQMFDHLLVLSEGRVMFTGPAANALPYFDGLGFKCPQYTNPSDFFLDLASISFRTPAAEAASRARIAWLADRFAETEGVAGAGGGKVPIVEGAPLPPPPPRTRTRLLLEFKELFKRAGKMALRQRLNNVVNLLRTCLFGLLLGLIWLNVGRHLRGSMADVRNLSGFIFFLLINHSFSAVFAVIFTFAGEYRNVQRERVAGVYGVSSYFAARTIVELPRSVLWTVILVSIVYFLVGFQAHASNFFKYVAILLLVEMSASSITLLVTAATGDEKIAAAVTPVPLIINILFGGFFISAHAIPVWLRWIRWCCFIFYANIALNKVEFEHRKLHCRPEELLMGCSQTGEEAFRRVAPDVPQRLSVFACSMTLIGFWLVNTIVTYIILRNNKPRYDKSV